MSTLGDELGNEPASPQLGLLRQGLTKRELFAAMAMQGLIQAAYTGEITTTALEPPVVRAGRATFTLMPPSSYSRATRVESTRTVSRTWADATAGAAMQRTGRIRRTSRRMKVP